MDFLNFALLLHLNQLKVTAQNLENWQVLSRASQCLERVNESCFLAHLLSLSIGAVNFCEYLCAICQIFTDILHRNICKSLWDLRQYTEIGARSIFGF
jgi:hypothetical protein